jgi:TatD DNase family protein
MRLTDTHCHLDFDRFDKDREEVVQRAMEVGVVRILVPGIDLSSSQAAIRLAEKYPQVYAAVGVHPNSGGTWETGTLPQIRSLSQHPKVVAIGEIGLDYYRQWTPHGVQKKILMAQLELALEVGLPVIIHCREAYRDILRIILDWVIRITPIKLSNAPGVFHSFSGNIEQVKLLTEKRFSFGISGPVTYKNADRLRRVVAEIPLERVLIETDAPFLTPHPRRGKRNEPAYVYYIAEKIAEICNISPLEIGDITSENSVRLFNW